jgi:hypothetical protein
MKRLPTSINMPVLREVELKAVGRLLSARITEPAELGCQ